MTVLPGEDGSAFEKLHRDLIAEFGPAGPMEEDIVATMARLVWRKQNLLTYRLAQWAKNRHHEIGSKFGPRYDFRFNDERSPDQIHADAKAMEEEIRNELGDTLVFIEMGEAVTIENLFKDLAVVDRINGMIDGCVKRLLMVRGAKSMSLTGTTSPSASRKRLVAV
jgi:hypothetical protein